MRRHRYKASRKSIFILLVRWIGKGTFQQSCEGNVRDLYEYPVKKESQPEELQLQNTCQHTWHIQGAGAIMMPARTVVKYKVSNIIEIRR